MKASSDSVYYFNEDPEVYYKNEQYCLNDKTYCIDADRIKTEHDLVCWIMHLCDKNWVSRKTISHLIFAFGQVNGIDTRGLV